MNTPFKMTPGRSPFLKTGRNIPLQMCSPAHQTDPASGLEAKAKALAEEKLKKNIEAKPLGGSTDVRKETATVSNIKLATTAEEIAKWKAGKDKPGAGRFNQSASAEATAKGADTDKLTSVLSTAQKPSDPSTELRNIASGMKVTTPTVDKNRVNKENAQLKRNAIQAKHARQREISIENRNEIKAKQDLIRPKAKPDTRTEEQKMKDQKAMDKAWRKNQRGGGPYSDGPGLGALKIKNAISSIFSGGCKTCN